MLEITLSYFTTTCTIIIFKMIIMLFVLGHITLFDSFVLKLTKSIPTFRI